MQNKKWPWQFCSLYGCIWKITSWVHQNVWPFFKVKVFTQPVFYHIIFYAIIMEEKLFLQPSLYHLPLRPPGSNSAQWWPWTTWSRSTMRWATCSTSCSTKTSQCPSATAPTPASTRPSATCWPYPCPRPNTCRASASWTKWRTTEVSVLLCCSRLLGPSNSRLRSLHRERHQLPDEHGARQDRLPAFRLPDGPVEMEGVWRAHPTDWLQQRVVEPEVSQ